MAIKTLGFLVVMSSALMAFAVPKAGEVTWYDPRDVGDKSGIGACGGEPLDKTMPIAALAKGYFDTYPGQTGNPNTNPLCGKQVTVTVNGKSVEVTVRDRCESCEGIYDIDISYQSLVELTGSPDKGRFQGSWDFVDPSLDIGSKPSEGENNNANPPNVFQPGINNGPGQGVVKRSVNDRNSHRPRRISRVMKRLLDNGVGEPEARGLTMVKKSVEVMNPKVRRTPKRLSRVMRGVVLDEQE